MTPEVYLGRLEATLLACCLFPMCRVPRRSRPDVALRGCMYHIDTPLASTKSQFEIDLSLL